MANENELYVQCHSDVRVSCLHGASSSSTLIYNLLLILVWAYTHTCAYKFHNCSFTLHPPLTHLSLQFNDWFLLFFLKLLRYFCHLLWSIQMVLMNQLQVWSHLVIIIPLYNHQGVCSLPLQMMVYPLGLVWGFLIQPRINDYAKHTIIQLGLSLSSLIPRLPLLC